MASLVLGAAPIVALPPSLPSSSCCSSRISFACSQTLGTSLSVSNTSISVSTTLPPAAPFVYCGRGDRKTAKGKRFNHSFGNARPRNKKKGRGPPKVPVPPSPSKKDKFDDNEKIKIEIDESFFSG